MNIDKPIITSDMARPWASVRSLVRAIRERLADISESELDTFSGQALHDHELSSAVSSLNTSLAAMFGIEESEQCRAQILDDNPQLVSRLAALHGEHRHLLSSIESIGELCDRGEQWRDIESRFNLFVRHLTLHEQREVDLFQSAAWDDIGVGD